VSSSRSRASRRASRTPTSSSTTTTGRYVLTLFEKIAREDLPFYLGFMDHLAHHDIVCPAPMRMDDGGFIAELNGKPACIVTRLPRLAAHASHRHDCRAAGHILAALHVAGVEYDAALANGHGQAWREHFAEVAAPRLSRAENALIDSENRYQGMHDDSVLPQGVIHGDLFRDNVLWDSRGSGGVIDFYFACDDVLLFDVAITANDWCTTPEATLDPVARARCWPATRSCARSPTSSASCGRSCCGARRCARGWAASATTTSRRTRT
jgi:homoserine kinase type II